MTEESQVNIPQLYSKFRAPISALDCGDRCAPYNEWGVPFCCDTRHAVPTAYQDEWEFLAANTNLWRLWKPDNPGDTAHLREQTPQGQVLIACQGHEYCQRDFRSITCRSFPFFPYIDRNNQFLGLSYYWGYENRCWIISNLSIVTYQYIQEFAAAYDTLFEIKPDELGAFRYHSIAMRRTFGRRRRAIPLLHRNGGAYKITPRNGRIRRVSIESFGKFEPYKTAAEMPFPDGT